MPRDSCPRLARGDRVACASRSRGDEPPLRVRGGSGGSPDESTSFRGGAQRQAAAIVSAAAVSRRSTKRSGVRAVVVIGASPYYRLSERRTNRSIVRTKYERQGL